jgi:hypothetical protein
MRIIEEQFEALTVYAALFGYHAERRSVHELILIVDGYEFTCRARGAYVAVCVPNSAERSAELLTHRARLLKVRNAAIQGHKTRTQDERR